MLLYRCDKCGLEETDLEWGWHGPVPPKSWSLPSRSNDRVHNYDYCESCTDHLMEDN